MVKIPNDVVDAYTAEGENDHSKVIEDQMVLVPRTQTQMHSRTSVISQLAAVP
jgi:hypothetical protein